MNIDNAYKRRVHIQGQPGDLYGYKIYVRDLETGEEITNVYAAVIMLDASHENQVRLLYHVADDNGILVDPTTDRTFTGEAITPDPVIDVTCREVKETA